MRVVRAMSSEGRAASRDSLAGSDTNLARSNYDKGTLPDNNALEERVGPIDQARSRHFNSTLPAGTQERLFERLRDRKRGLRDRLSAASTGSATAGIGRAFSPSN